MKKLFLSGILFLMPIFALSAGQYFGVHGGTDYGFKTNGSNSGQKVGFKAGAVYGYDVAANIRAEAEVSYRQGAKRTRYNDAGEDELASKAYDTNHSWAYMGNLIYDVSQLKMWTLTPFVGAGAGYVQSVEHRKIKYALVTNSEKRRDSGFAYQAIAGLTYIMTDANRVNVQYCYHIASPHAKNHSVTVGLVKTF